MQPGNLLPEFLRAEVRKSDGTGDVDGDCAAFSGADSGDGPRSRSVDAELAPEEIAAEIDVHAAAAAELYSAGCRIAIFAAHRLHALKGYKRLGYRDAASYCTEELGIRARRFRSMVRLGKRLRRLPEIRRAFLRRQITWVQAEVLAGIATPDDEGEWIDTARGRSVRQLKVLVKAARARRRRSDSEDGRGTGNRAPRSRSGGVGEDRASGSGDGAVATDRTPCSPDAGTTRDQAPGPADERVAKDRTRVPDERLPRTDSKASSLGESSGHLGEEDDDEEEYRRRRLATPGWFPGKFVRVKGLLETVAGHDVPDGVAVELMAAEFLSGAEARLAMPEAADSADSTDSVIAVGEAAECSGAPATTADPPRLGGNGAEVRRASRSAVDGSASGTSRSSLHGRDGTGVRSVRFDGDRPSSERFSRDRPEVDLPAGWEDFDPDRTKPPYISFAERLKEYRSMQPLFGADDPRDFCTKDTPWQLHRMLLKGIRRERQVSWQLGRMLREIKDRQLWRPLGYRGFVPYVGGRLGISLRTAQRLIRIDREAGAYPDLTDAYRSGRLPLLKATGLLRVLKLGADEKAWIRYAGAMSYQRLCDSIRSAEAGAARDPETWRRSGGRPPAIPELPGARVVNGTVESDDGDEARSPARPVDQDPANAPTFVAPQPEPSDAAPTFVTPQLEPSDAAPTFVTPQLEPSDAAPTFVADPDTGERVRSFGLEPYGPGWGRQPAPSRLDLFLTDGQAGVVHRAFACVRKIRGPKWPDWACLNDLIDHTTREYDGGAFRAMRRDFPILDRDGWRCKVPGCRARSPLHVHHIRFRSRGGGDEPENLVTLCDFHHLALHSGIIRCRGRAPNGVYWELGRSQLTSARFKEEPIARFFGDRRLPHRYAEAGGGDPGAAGGDAVAGGDDPEAAGRDSEAADVDPEAGSGVPEAAGREAEAADGDLEAIVASRRPRLGMTPSEERAYLREEAGRLGKCVGFPETSK